MNIVRMQATMNSTATQPYPRHVCGSFEPTKVIKRLQASNKVMQTKWPTYFSIYNANDGCTQAHADNEAYVPMILYEYCARASHDEHGGDVDISSPRQRVLRANERYQQAAKII